MPTSKQIGHRSSRKRRVCVDSCLLALSCLLFASGCNAVKNDAQALNSNAVESGKQNQSLLDKIIGKKPDQTNSQPMSTKIRWDGGGVILGETDNPIFSPESFIGTVSDLAREQRFRSIGHLVRSYPDVALKALQELNPTTHEKMSMALIAENFQQHWGSSKPGDAQNEGWVAYVNETQTQQTVFDKKVQFWEYLKLHETQKALDLQLRKSIKGKGSATLVAECLRLESIALMLDNNFDEAINRLSQSIDETKNVCAFQTNHSRLLLGEFYRHSGQIDKWKSNWQLAVVEQSQLIAGQHLIDPSFWNRAAFLRPAGIAWPSVAIDNMRGFLDSIEFSGSKRQSINLNDEAVVWLMIGLQHLSRGEGQNAVLALKKSEAATSDPEAVDQLRIHQARAMVMAAQPGAASAILIRLISNNEGEVIADRAKAILGALKLQNGAIGQGVNLIQTSLKSVSQWPRDERLRAQADYALALLVKGNEGEGLPQLEQVRQEFAAIGEIDQAQQCLWNKAKYFEKTEQKEQHVKALAELSDFERL